MQYIKVSNDVWIEYNEETKQSKTIIKSELEQQKEVYKNRLKDIKVITDEMIIEWARQNYPFQQNQDEINTLTKDIESIDILLGNLNG